MALNKTEQSLEDKLIRDIEDMKQQLITLKTHLQPMGADMLDIRTGNVATATSSSVPAGSAINVSFSVNPVSDLVLSLYNFEVTVYVDVFNDTNKYPDGSLITSPQRNLKFESWLDWADSWNDIAHSFIRVYKIRIVNNDSSAHVYYVNYQAVFPKFTAA